MSANQILDDRRAAIDVASDLFALSSQPQSVLRDDQAEGGPKFFVTARGSKIEETMRDFGWDLDTIVDCKQEALF